ncbi:hypothetical protein [Schlesneria paludicola]|uniref:hypothetical protein n=1 Tax=Schlesneria paludicola TaxID=360056 RepID=UPI00029ABB08|nr:hypothetical protein [Schlesneria paludicola]
MVEFFKYPRRRIGLLTLVNALEFFVLWVHAESRGVITARAFFFPYFITPLTLLTAYLFISKPMKPKASHQIMKKKNWRRDF